MTLLITVTLPFHAILIPQGPEYSAVCRGLSVAQASRAADGRLTLVSTLRKLAEKYSSLGQEEIDWLELLTFDWPLLADLALGDVVL